MGRSIRTGNGLGFSMVEMLASLVIFSILAVMAAPMAETYRDRQTEVILKDRLSRIRAAIRSYAASELTTINTGAWRSPCLTAGSIAIPGDIDGDGVAGEDGAGDTNGDGLADDDFDGNVDEDGPPIYPPTLADLVDKGYLGSPALYDDKGTRIPASEQFPRDPLFLDATVTDNTKTWIPLYVTRHFRFHCKGDKPGDPLHDVSYTGIYDVRSSAPGNALSGQPYYSF